MRHILLTLLCYVLVYADQSAYTVRAEGSDVLLSIGGSYEPLSNGHSSPLQAGVKVKLIQKDGKAVVLDGNKIVETLSSSNPTYKVPSKGFIAELGHLLANAGEKLPNYIFTTVSSANAMSTKGLGVSTAGQVDLNVTITEPYYTVVSKDFVPFPATFTLYEDEKEVASFEFTLEDYLEVNETGMFFMIPTKLFKPGQTYMIKCGRYERMNGKINIVP